MYRFSRWLYVKVCACHALIKATYLLTWQNDATIQQEIYSHKPFLPQSELEHFDSSHQITFQILLPFPFTLKKRYLRLINNIATQNT